MEPEKKSNGALIGSIIIILILIIGGLYLWKNMNGKENNQTTVDSDLEDIQGRPIEATSSMEAELDNIDLDSLDSDL